MGAAVSHHAGTGGDGCAHLAIQLIIGRKRGIREREIASLTAIGGLDSEGRHGWGLLEGRAEDRGAGPRIRMRYIALQTPAVFGS